MNKEKSTQNEQGEIHTKMSKGEWHKYGHGEMHTCIKRGVIYVSMDTVKSTEEWTQGNPRKYEQEKIHTNMSKGKPTQVLHASMKEGKSTQILTWWNIHKYERGEIHISMNMLKSWRMNKGKSTQNMNKWESSMNIVKFTQVWTKGKSTQVWTEKVQDTYLNLL
jgi:hypothetical protein